MYARSEPQQWTVHAEFTIKHDGVENDNKSRLPETHAERDENGVHMVYSWSSQPSTNNNGDNKSDKFVDPSTLSGGRDPQLPYGFQKGNLVFTSTPPKRYVDSGRLGVNVNDSSGYSSEMLSPNSGSLPYRQCNRKCRSTCSIILSTDFNHKHEDSPKYHCNRTQSLRCQTPSVKNGSKDVYYGCGDPWCYHSNHGDDSCRFPPLQECDEPNSSSSSLRPSRASTFAMRRSDRSGSTPVKDSKQRDASVQTFEMIDKCTSPFPFTGPNLRDSDSDVKLKKEKNFRKKAAYNARRRTEPIHQRVHSPSSITPDSLENQQVYIVLFYYARIGGNIALGYLLHLWKDSYQNKLVYVTNKQHVR